jgi:hypothetical protein
MKRSSAERCKANRDHISKTIKIKIHGGARDARFASLSRPGRHNTSRSRRSTTTSKSRDSKTSSESYTNATRDPRERKKAHLHDVSPASSIDSATASGRDGRSTATNNPAFRSKA